MTRKIAATLQRSANKTVAFFVCLLLADVSRSMSLCFEEKASFNSWLSCLRLAKFGNQLRDAYIAKDTASCHDASSPAARTTQGCAAAAAVAGVTVPSSDNFRLFSKFGKHNILILICCFFHSHREPAIGFSLAMCHLLPTYLQLIPLPSTSSSLGTIFSSYPLP